MASVDIEQVLSSLEETLAKVEHERWSHWQRYLHAKCVTNSDGSLTIPSNFAAKWSRQARTSYADLSESEKQSDREQVQRYLPIIAEAVRAAS